MVSQGEESKRRIELTGTDEWLLQAIRAASGAKGATLSEVIAWGDALNHAIFTPAELRSGFAKLLAARYIAERDGRWFISELNQNPDVVGNSRKATDPEVGEPCWSYPISDEVIHGAIAAYLKQQPTPALPRLHVDFNEMFEDGSVDLRGSQDDLDTISPLREGLRVALWDEDAPTVTAALHYDESFKMWVAIPDNHSCAICGKDIGCGATFREECSDCGRAYCKTCKKGFCYSHGNIGLACPICKRPLT